MTSVQLSDPASDQPRSRSRVRLVPAPVTNPPYDDELLRAREGEAERARSHDLPVLGVQGALALDFVLPSGLPAVPQPPPRLRLVGRDLAPQPARTPPDEAAARRPEASRWAPMIVQAIVEVLAGDRPMSQLVRWTTPEVYEQLTWRRQRRTTRLGEAGGGRRSVVTSVHVCQPADGVAETCATIRREGRATAIALRLEADRDIWRCTAVMLR